LIYLPTPFDSSSFLHRLFAYLIISITPSFVYLYLTGAYLLSALQDNDLPSKKRRKIRMVIALSKLEKFFSIEKVIIHSLDLSLYQASVLVDNKQLYITDNKRRFIRATSVIAMQKILSNVKTGNMVLQQNSAYDEMIGLPASSGSNSMEVPIHDNKLY
tara:strand:- start:7883 stop:8359 length:477 start_codon:yes stop_codon:yes gene_type:complete